MEDKGWWWFGIVGFKVWSLVTIFIFNSEIDWWSSSTKILWWDLDFWSCSQRYWSKAVARGSSSSLHEWNLWVVWDFGIETQGRTFCFSYQLVWKYFQTRTSIRELKLKFKHKINLTFLKESSSHFFTKLNISKTDSLILTLLPYKENNYTRRQKQLSLISG